MKSSFNAKLAEYIKNVKKPNNTSEYVRVNKKIVSVLLDYLYNSALTFAEIISNKNYYLFKTKLIPLLEIAELVLMNGREFNSIIYDYLLLDENDFYNKYKNHTLWIYAYPTEARSILMNITLNNDATFEKFFDILSRYIVTITGTLFYKHSEKTGHVINIINNLMKERKKLKSRLKELDPNSKDYEILYRAQLSIKVLLNSLYGIYGLTTYRYNEKNIANTITTSGRFLIKSAQYVANEVIKDFLKNFS